MTDLSQVTFSALEGHNVILAIELVSTIVTHSRQSSGGR